MCGGAKRPSVLVVCRGPAKRGVMQVYRRIFVGTGRKILAAAVAVAPFQSPVARYGFWQAGQQRREEKTNLRQFSRSRLTEKRAGRR